MSRSYAVRCLREVPSHLLEEVPGCDLQIIFGASVPHTVRDGSGDDASYASNSSINFGLSPHDLFNRAHNAGQYHEYEHHDDGDVERGFGFQLDAQSSLDSASDSRSIDDHG